MIASCDNLGSRKPMGLISISDEKLHDELLAEN